jgi:hypothetical protein
MDMHGNSLFYFSDIFPGEIVALTVFQGLAFYFWNVQAYLISRSVCIMWDELISAWAPSSSVEAPTGPRAHYYVHDRMQPQCGGMTNQKPISYN